MNLELKIVNFLSRNIGRSFTINEISRSLGEYYSFVHRTINKLIEDGIIIKNKVGKSHLCSPNLENEKTMALIQLSEIESRDEYYDKNKELKLILEDFVNSVGAKSIISIVLFGSYAKGTATKESDIDILVIHERKFNADKTTKEIYAKYGKEINAIIMTVDQFKKQKSRPIVKDIIHNHYILYGAENFVKMVFEK